METNPVHETWSETEAKVLGNNFTQRLSVSSSSKSSTSRKKTKNKRNNDADNKEVDAEDEIFFKDDMHPSDVHRDAVADRDLPGMTRDALEMSSRRRQIVQDILASFDLEQVMDRYRGETVSRSLSKRRFRKWLHSAMAENKAHFNDRQWIEQFGQKVLGEYERKQDERERILADAESQRILKLKLQGVIRDEEEEARREELAMRKTFAEKRFDRLDTKKHQSLFKPNDIETQMEILNRCERETNNRNSSQGDNDGNEGLHGNNSDSSSEVAGSSLPTYKSQLGRMNTDTNNIHPKLRDLYEQEDLERMYREAENLIQRPRKK